MDKILLEHVNVTVTDAKKSAALLCRLFDWKVRWQGTAKDDGHTVHVGDDQSYVAFHTPPRKLNHKPDEYRSRTLLNHIGIIVEDIDVIEARVRAVGLKPHSHQYYVPGKRFYFNDQDGVEYEIVSYSNDVNRD